MKRLSYLFPKWRRMLLWQNQCRRRRCNVNRAKSKHNLPEIEAASNYSTVDTLKQQYCFVPAKYKDGMLKHKNKYEIMSPEGIGLHRSDESGIVLGKLSGCHALRSKLLELCYDIDGKELDDLFWHFKTVAEKKKTITDDDLIALVSDEVFQPQVVWKLGDVQVTCGSLGLSTATVRLIDADGEEHIACSVGTGPVDSAYKAVDLIVKVPVTLLEYSMNAVTVGIDAIATTQVLIRGDNNQTSTNAYTGQDVQRTYSGTGASMDIVISSVRAYIGALNKMLGIKINQVKSYPETEALHI